MGICLEKDCLIHLGMDPVRKRLGTDLLGLHHLVLRTDIDEEEAILNPRSFKVLNSN